MATPRRRRTRLLFGGLIATVLAGAANAQSRPATLAIDGGLIAAASPQADGVAVFKGLPYAAPPVGSLRWRPPAPLKAWTGVRATDAFAPDCLQATSNASPASRPKSEDCLYLNVWAPPLAAGTKPVFVWIHGGGSRVGSGAQPQFDGAALAAKGVIVVTINYRLGPFGFLSTRELSAESGYGASGDYGFMDDIAALQWVQRNISAFGGDPARVTIGGESSGSVSTGTLMASPLAKGLFAGVIGESGSVFRVAEYGSMGATRLAVEEAKGERLQAALGAPDLATFRAVPAATLLAKAGSTPGAAFNLPVVDGHVLPLSPWQAFAQHRQNDVPLLVGWNADEGSMQLLAHLGTLTQTLAQIYGKAGPALAPFYAGQDDVHAAIRAAGDNGIAYGTWKWGYAQQSFGKRPVYVYEFDRAPPISSSPFGTQVDASLAGAFHGAEIPYVFNTLGSEPSWKVTAGDQRVADQMSSYWANFIKAGNPNGAGLPTWPSYGAGAPQRLRIGLKTGAEVDPDHARFLAIKAAHDQIDPADPAPPTP